MVLWLKFNSTFYEVQDEYVEKVIGMVMNPSLLLSTKNDEKIIVTAVGESIDDRFNM